jgi:hypothetical protein
VALPVGGSLERDVPTLAIHAINGESAGNYRRIDKESSQGWVFLRELPAYLRVFRPVRSKFAENPSNGNNFKISSFKSKQCQLFKKFKYENVNKIKNKPEPAQ